MSSLTGKMRKMCRLLWLHLLLFLVITGPCLACGPGRRNHMRRKNRKMTPLVFKQHVPNVSERNLGASGAAEGPIKRDSPEFKKLVVNSNRDIIFKDEEGTGADKYMTQRCKEKLNTLAISVMNTWPNVKLRVTEAWDEDHGEPYVHHAKDSLHYEGRAVDITTSDRDRTKYGTLARLAVEAGFDWVYFMSRGHIHCSVKSESSITTRTGGCFHGSAVVQLESGRSVPLRLLQEGDRVLTMNSYGQPEYSEVLIFMDHDANKTTTFYTLVTEAGKSITLTSNHLIPVGASKEAKPVELEARFAGYVEVGDFVSVTDVTGALVLSRVTAVFTSVQEGVYAPLTTSGNIIIDGVLASCYGLIDSHAIAHAVFAPLRQTNFITSYFRRKPTNGLSSSHSGVHWYADMLYSVAPYVLPESLWHPS